MNLDPAWIRIEPTLWIRIHITGSKVGTQPSEVRNQLRTIYDRILEFQAILDTLYQDTVAEVSST